ncbi:APC family permease [Nocardioides litoris]|uniref:APC family permease n=1 Tax=Nocardioides litoris TaxID=1926648 RepID=UPI00111E68ED|nr:APC family permease [Nocardioides litoris]
MPTGSRLRAGAVGTTVSTVFSLSSTAPAYSLAVSVGLLVALVGAWTPWVLVVSALPVVLVVLCFARLNAAEPDCGTCYAWVSRAFGPRTGWLTGWVAMAACVLVMSNLVQVAAIYALDVVGADHLADQRWAQAVLGLALLGLMAWLAHRGITMAARTQVVLFTLEVVAILYFAQRALTADPLPPLESAAGAAGTPSWSALSAAFLVAVFLYWGWDSSFAVNEESDDPGRTPARSALLAMAGLVVLYAGFTWAVIGWAGADRLAAVGEEDLFVELGSALVATPAGTLLAGAVLLSALASAQTTILPSARAAFSMARRGDLPQPLARVSAQGSPSVATWTFTALSGSVYAVLVLTSDSVLTASVAATAVLVAAYYAVTCATVPFHDRAATRARPGRLAVVPGLTAALFIVVLVASLGDVEPASLVAVAVVAVLGLAGALRFARPDRTPTALPPRSTPRTPAERTHP